MTQNSKPTSVFSRFTAALNTFRNSGGESTLASPSSDLVHALIGLPAAAGKPVTKETAIRVAAFLGGVKMLSNDLAKMPLILRETKVKDGRQRTQPAIDEPLYTLLKDCPNQWQTSFQMRWFMASQVIMNGNCFAQKITNQAGDITALIPLNAWQMMPHWDRSGKQPILKWRYNNSGTGLTEFAQQDIWHVAATNLEGMGLEGSPLVILAKEALSLLMAAEEVAGRNFANGLGMGGFISFPDMENAPNEAEAQNIVDRLRKDFSGSQNAGRFTMIPGGGKFEKMSFNAAESQLLESRKWSEQEVVRLLGGAPLLVKMGLGEQNSTYASASSFLEEYFNTSLLPYTTAIEQSITRDLIPRKQWGQLYAKHNADIILRGSPKERAETLQVRINSWQLTPNEARLMEDLDSIEGGDFLCGPANGAIFNPVTQQFFIPGQADPNTPEDANELAGAEPGEQGEAGGPDTAGDGDGNTAPPTKPPVPAKPSKAKARLELLAQAMADRVLRKESKGKIDAKFVAEVLNISTEQAEDYAAKRMSMTEAEARAALIALAIGD